MKHIREKCQQQTNNNLIWNFYFENMRIGILDIETTGINPQRNKFVLGCIYDISEGVLHQLLAEKRAEEPVALKAYIDIISGMDMVVTYNGRNFDMPFIDRRWRSSLSGVNYLCHEMDRGRKQQDTVSALEIYNLDLFKVIKGYSPLKNILPNLKQKTVENYMGLWSGRTDEISGAGSVELYNHYEATGDAEAEAKILLHNNDDVRQLTKLTKALDKCNVHKAMFNMGFPIKTGEHILKVDYIEIRKESLAFGGTYRGGHVSYTGFEFREWPARIFINHDRFDFEVPLIRQQGFAIIDIEAASIDTGEFSAYPGYGKGFIIIEDGKEIKYKETNHFIKAFVQSFFEEEI